MATHRLTMHQILFLGLLLAAKTAFPQEESKNIIISSLKEKIEFEKGNKEHPVLIRHSTETVYLCNDFRSTTPIVESYDDEESIDDVDVFVNEKKVTKYVQIHREPYSSEGIFYSDQKVLYFNLPLEKKGSTSEVRMKKTIFDPRYLDAFFFNNPYPVQLHEITLIIPDWVTTEIREFNFPGYSIHKTSDEKGGSKTIVYTVSNLPARPDETSSPGITFTSPHIMLITQQAQVSGNTITYFKNTSDQYAWYASLVREIGNDAVTIKAKADEIVKGKATDIEKIKAIYFWVQQNIRYLAFENGIAGFRPEKAQEVLRRKYGDCKGMANLTKCLLTSQGYDARLCWIGTNHIAYDYSIPSLAVDNHMICALYFKNKLYFLDATETNSGFEEYAERIQGRQVLIENSDKYVLEHVPQTSYTQNTETEIRELQVEGTAFKGSGTQTFSGESKESLISNMESVKKDKLENSIRNYLNGGKKDYEISDLVMTNSKPEEGKMSLQYNLVQQNAVSIFGNDMYVDLDFRKSYSSFKIDTVKRKLDYVFPYKLKDITETTLVIPAGYQAQNLPPEFSLQNPVFDIKIGYTRQPGKIIFRKEINIKQAVLKKGNFSQWNKAIDGLNEFYNNQLTLTKS
jgi:transglutaminase-like putative cysteine protease